MKIAIFGAMGGPVMVDRGLPKEVVCTKQKQVIQQILRNLAKVFIFSPTSGPGEHPLSDSMGSSSLWLYSRNKKKLLNRF